MFLMLLEKVRKRYGVPLDSLASRLMKKPARTLAQVIDLSILIVRHDGDLGRHSRLPLQDLFVGATAERLIRSSSLPVLVVSLKVAGPYRRPLVAVDLADTSKAVVRLALRVLGPGVNRLERSLEELGIEWDSTIVRADPQTAILAEAIRRRTDLLTIGTHGRGGCSGRCWGAWPRR